MGNSNNNSNDGSLKFDISHASKHFLKGTYDHATTQKGYTGDGSFQTYTDVERDGTVGESGFGNFNKTK